MLRKAIVVKRQELVYLQGLFSEKSYTEEAQAIVKEVVAVLVNDAGKEVANDDGSSAVASWPSWILVDFNKMKKTCGLFPARAVALAFV